MPNNFADLLSHWQQDLQAVAASFVAGNAQVAPKNVQSCHYCELSSLCRIASVQTAEPPASLNNTRLASQGDAP